MLDRARPLAPLIPLQLAATGPCPKHIATDLALSVSDVVCWVIFPFRVVALRSTRTSDRTCEGTRVQEYLGGLIKSLSKSSLLALRPV